MTESNTNEAAFLEGFHDIPSTKELSKMEYVQLAELLANSRPGTAKYISVENVLLKHRDSAQKKNTSYGVKLGGVISLVGVVLGVLLSYLLSNSETPIMVTCDVKCENVQRKNESISHTSTESDETALCSKVSEEVDPSKSVQPTADGSAE